MRLIRRLKRDEGGYTMIAAIGATMLVTVLVSGSLAAVEGDLNITKSDQDHKKAYEAAMAGLGDYSYHLNEDNGYWAKCTTVPTPTAVNQMGSTANRRSVAGSTTATYALELIPATGQSSCDPSNPTQTMLESGGTNDGTFRIRATGYAGEVRQSVVATYKRANFLDYVYFTQLETSDPVTYGDPQTIAGANIQCTKTIQQGRYNQPIPNSGGQFCTKIVFVSGDDINGPLHTNDALMICGQPTFGRNASDVTEVSSPPQGWISECGGGDDPNFQGPFLTNAPVLTPPPTNGQLETIAGPSATYTGQTRIVLSGTNMTVTPSGGSPTTVPIPSSGVVYIKNGACSSSYSPFTTTYPNPSTCGNVLVSGTYSGNLTIAAENDVIIEDDLFRTGNGMLGLIANNFVRVKHPICPSSNLGCSNGTITSQTGRGQCNSGVNGTGTQSNLNIDAAILAIQHSFIVDHYDCGNSLGTLTVEGAISQRFRGPVGTTGGTGYLKNYVYDDRLRFQEPPHFLDPLQTAWNIRRTTLDFP